AMPAPTPPDKFTAHGRIQAIDPRTWEVVETVDPHSQDELQAALHRARSAQSTWAELEASERSSRLAPLLERIVDQAEELASTIHQEHGKSITEAMFSEVMGAAEVVRFQLKAAPRWLKPETVAVDPLSYPGKKGRVEFRPRGIVAVIMPWNYPLALPMRTLVPALLAGNAVLFKPSEHAALVGRAIGELFSGLLPEGLLQVIQGGGDIGAALSASPEIDGIVFTGSARTGKAVARAAAENLVPVSLELGGKDAAIVCSDADLERSASGIAWAAFHNSGQNCAAVERVYVEQPVYDEFLEKLAEATATLRTSGDQELTEVGPLCTAEQFATVESQLADAVAQGARVVTGGQPTGQGWGFQPTVLADVPEGCEVWTEETFGPILPVRKVHSVYEAVDLTNASPYGLSVSVWGRELGRAEEVARRCEVGMALVNNHAFTGSLPNAPWVGTKASGSGVTGSSMAMKFLTRPQLVMVDRSKVREIWWFPLNSTALAMGRTALQTLVASPFRKLGLLLRLIGLLRKRWKS
ncbi:MAG: aldehyde dehydrogenase family protein, partial [Myxococcota bacterium]|nr:aldehyde dehydrogenase family protein [Myxococcota bacterium]